MKAKIFVCLIMASFLCAPLGAQTVSRVKSPVQWSYDAAGGLNFIYNSAKLGGVSGSGQIAVISMVMPQLGFRIGLDMGAVRGVAGDSLWKFGDRAAFRSTVCLDIMWDIIRTFSDNRSAYSILPFARFSGISGYGKGNTAFSVGLGGGIRQVFRLDRHFGLLLDINGVISRESAWGASDGRLLFGQVVFGLNYCL